MGGKDNGYSNMRGVNGFLYFGMAVMGVSWFLHRKNIYRNPVGEKVSSYGKLVLILFVANSISFALTFRCAQQQITIERPGYGEEEVAVSFQLEQETQTEDFVLQVKPKQYEERELQEKMKAAFDDMESRMPGENESLNLVREHLVFETDYATYPFDVQVEPVDYSLVEEDGTIHNSLEELCLAGYTRTEIEQGILTDICVRMSYGEYRQERTYHICIFAQKESEQEQRFSDTKSRLTDMEQQTQNEDTFTIPAVLEGVSIKQSEQKTPVSLEVLVLGIVLAVILFVWEKEVVVQREKRRKQQLLRSYPWFVNEMVLMLGAGMQVKYIFAQMFSEYTVQGKEDDREALIRELEVANRAFALGMPEEQVYYQLGRRLQLSCYIKLMTLLEQNVKKGARGLKDIFEQEEKAALEERKNLAKKLGEEAGTKLLGPMIVLLMIIMLMIMLPAFMSF